MKAHGVSKLWKLRWMPVAAVLLLPVACGGRVEQAPSPSPAASSPAASPVEPSPAGPSPAGPSPVVSASPAGVPVSTKDLVPESFTARVEEVDAKTGKLVVIRPGDKAASIPDKRDDLKVKEVRQLKGIKKGMWVMVNMLDGAVVGVAENQAPPPRKAYTPDAPSAPPADQPQPGASPAGGGSPAPAPASPAPR